MNVKLTRKLSSLIDGIDLTDHSVGEILDLSDSEARILVAEGWAEHATSQRDGWLVVYVCLDLEQADVRSIRE